ncbi:MAG: Calx-beta domain-containing protein [Nostoc sp.]|uniref:Calx-beta domain-containing protein n=1 Tax=Nostoc sp. TaxID=1180 RepID=UPI002FFC934D
MTKQPKNNRVESQYNSVKDILEASKNIVFIDTAVIDYQCLVAGIALGSEVVILDPNKDGLTQINEFLAGCKSNSVQSVHIVSHGSEGSLQLGSTYLSLTNLNNYANQLRNWASVLTDKADILLYGCDVASGSGNKFVQFLSRITGADVAASTDKTGSAALGGDWDLEVKTGKIEASLAFKPEVIQAYQSILPASFTGTYSQSFSTLASSGTSISWANDSTILGWYATRTNYNVGSGSNSTGGLYSFGTTGDRALGSVASGTTGTIYYGLRLQNNTGSSITQLQVGYTGEQWRNGGNTSPQQLKFSYQTGSTLTNLTTGTWNSATSLDFTSPIANATAAALNGNQVANKVVITPITITLATPIANGEEIILRWEDIDDGGNDHGLAIDDVSVKVDNSTYIVTNTNDSGAGSLRQAIINANNDPGIETIIFDPTGIFGDATPDTITLTSGELNVTEGVIIQGTGANKLTISGNNASRVFNASASLSIDGLNITGGNAGSSNGGGIYSTSSVTLSNSTIFGNTTNNGGGGIYTNNATVSNSTIFGNTANNNGGGIYSSTSLSISNSTISSNTSKSSGGGIYTSNATVSNSTIFENTADSDNNGTGNGGGIFRSGGTVNISNSIIAGNIDTGNQGPDIFGNNFNGNAYNLIGKIAGKSSGTLGTGTDIINPNPGLKPLGNYGGSTQTHALSFSSPATNAGDPGYSGGLTTDQRGTGFNRIESGRIDIGAFEYVLPKVSFGAATYNAIEDSTATIVTIAVTLDASPETAVTVPIVVKNSSTATSGDDYTFSPTTISFTAGATGSNLTKLITFTINPDDLPENAETVVLNFGTLTGADLGTITETTLTIAANDSIQYAISSATSNLTEGNSGTQAVTFTVTRSGGIGVASTIDYVFGGTATFGSDYNNIQVTGGGTAASGTLSFAVGEKTKTITADVLSDNIFELDEDITVNLNNPNLTAAPANSTITNSSATVNISNDDNQPTISISDVSVTEGNTGTTTNANFTISLSNPSYQPITVNYSTSDSTAQATDSDYNSALGTITFAPGETSKVISIGVIGDNKFETNEAFSVNLLGATNAAIADNLGVGTIVNDDNQPTISISDVSVTEGNTGTTTNANFTISLSNPSYQPITVNYNTSDDTAQAADSDYNSASGTITFAPGETSKVISIGVIGDNKFETNEAFNVNLLGATNATITDSLGVATISNDDNQPTISISDVSVTEGNTGTTTNANFTISLSNPSYQQITVNYNTSDGTAQVADSDYNSASGTITFAPGETSKVISIGVIGDNKFEGNEAFNVNLLGATNAAIADNLGVGTIVNDDNQPAIAISDVSVTEGNTGTTTNANFTISLSNPSYQQITVNYNTSDSTAQVADSDYNFASGTIIFAPGETSKVISIDVIGDNKFESDETFAVNLLGATNAAIADNLGVGTIINDDNQPTISISDVSVTEGNTGTTTNANFTISLSNPSYQPITVNYNTSDDTAQAADSDYNSALGTITFAPGETSKTLSIGIIGDNKFETNEAFNVNLLGATNAAIADNLGVATIINDDNQPTISISDVSVTEGNTGTTTNANFTISLSNPSYQPITVNYNTSDDTAQAADSDYNSASGTITFAPGETSKVISIGVIGDNKFETNEAFNVNLLGATNATITDSLGVATISNDDNQPTISISDVSVTEGNTGTTTNANFTISLSNPSYQQVTVNYNTSDSTAQAADSDYNSASGTIIFAPGETSKVISIGVIGDNQTETDETFAVNLLGATNAAIADNLGVGTIVNDENQPAIAISDVSVTEGNAGTTTNANFTISLSNVSSQQVTVNYNTSDGTAQVADSDYNSASGTIIFAPGETSKVISIGVIGDNKFESDETFAVNLLGATNAAIADNLGVGTISNDDNQPTISISDVSVTEGNTGTTTNANFTISLSNPSYQPITVNYNTSDGTAQVADSDYNSASGMIIFAPGETSKVISIGVIGDNKVEANETFSVNLSGATNATSTDNLGVGSINDDDNQTTISISDISLLEGNAGTTTNANFTVTLSATSSQQVSVNYGTSDGTAKVSDSDYNLTSGTINFAPGETSKVISIGVIGDNKVEVNETFSVNLLGATNATITDSLGVASIINDDEPPAISIADVSVKEGTTGMITNAKFVVTLSNEFYQSVIVNYGTSDGTAKVSDSDYNSGLGTIIFAPGETSKTISIGVTGDNKVENDETFFVNLYGAANARFAKNQGVGIIINDDLPAF